MRPERPALLFDLDDTLYPLRDFVLSGFRAVAEFLATQHRVDADEAFGVLAAASRQRRGRELQTCLERFALHSVTAANLLRIHREHTPTLSLPVVSRRVLATLRPGWALAVVTNGSEDVQARKVSALGLLPLVDTIVYANSCGNGVGKPDPAGFHEALRRLGTAPGHAVVVGNDPACDIEGARRAGLKSVLLASAQFDSGMPGTTANACISSLSELGAVAAGLLEPVPTAQEHGHAA